MTTIKIPQGTDGGCRWLVKDANDLPVDFTDWEIHSQVRNDVADDLVLHEWSSADGSATGGDDGYITIHWGHAETSLWDWTSAVYDLEITSPEGKVTRLDSGRVSVSRQVTRDD
jgi:hypothetical protein